MKKEMLCYNVAGQPCNRDPDKTYKCTTGPDGQACYKELSASELAQRAADAAAHQTTRALQAQAAQLVLNGGTLVEAAALLGALDLFGELSPPRREAIKDLVADYCAGRNIALPKLKG